MPVLKAELSCRAKAVAFEGRLATVLYSGREKLQQHSQGAPSTPVSTTQENGAKVEARRIIW